MTRTQLKLTALLPNPHRDFAIDPISEIAVKTLMASIDQDGFWGGVVIRKNKNGEYEIICGHHRVEAARALGIGMMDFHIIEDLSDEAAVRIYGRENASQRGNTSTAIAGTIAAAIKVVAKKVFSEGREISPPSNLDAIQQGIGYSQLEKFLSGVPGINVGVIKQQLAILKASGHYARILKSVQKEVEAENKARAEELTKEAEEATKAGDTRAADTAKKRAAIAVRKTETLNAVIEKEKGDPSIDLRVASILATPSVAATFFDMAIKNVQYLPVGQQSAFAEHLVQKAASVTSHGEITSRFIREYFVDALIEAKRGQRKITKEEELAASLQSWNERMRFLQKEAAKYARLFADTIFQISQLDKKRPKNTSVHSTDGLNIAIESIKAGMAALKKIGIA